MVVTGVSLFSHVLFCQEPSYPYHGFTLSHVIGSGSCNGRGSRKKRTVQWRKRHVGEKGGEVIEERFKGMFGIIKDFPYAKYHAGGKSNIEDIFPPSYFEWF
ncbi:hypothetical protein VNO77_02119 [Canavalia gladiata]|uniref:Uncharacterized protein n=1 Tax=Canavalia gladiata TaxID=3824 RepID=A0AAN9R2R4_CANGL